MKKAISFIFGVLLLSVSCLSSCSSDKDKLAHLHDEQGLAGLRVATSTGSCYDIELSKRDDIQLLLFNSDADQLQALLSGQADVLVQDETVFNSEIRKEYGIQIAFKGEQAFPTALVFRKDEPDLVQAMNAVLATMEEDGTLKQLKDFWLTEEYLDNRLFRHIPVETTGENPLRVACVVNLAPISFVVGKEWYGLEVDLARALSSYLHRPLEFKLYDMSGIMALKNGLADLLIGGMFVTPERQMQFLFAEPYHNFHPAYYIRNPEVKATSTAGFWEKIGKSLRRNLVEENRWQYITGGLLETLKITFFSILLGSVLGMGVCALSRSRRKWMRGVAGFYSWFMSSIPILVLLLILFYVVFVGSGLSPATVAIIAFSLDFAAGAGEIYSTSLSAIPHGQTEAGLALGFTRLQTFFHIVLPQALKRGLPLFQGQCISLLKGTSIVGYIAIQDLTRAGDLIRSRTFDPFVPLLIVTLIYFLLAWLIILLLKLVTPKKQVL